MGRNTGKFPAVRSPSGRHRTITGKVRVRRSVLVVDDEPEVARLVGKILGKDYNVLYASDGEEALERAAADVPDLILLDLNLPKLDGWEVCRRLKATPKLEDIPVVLMTASSSTAEDANRGFKLGAAEFLVKPFVREVLVHNIERILGER
jgi:putative two-component system response regulator